MLMEQQPPCHSGPAAASQDSKEWKSQSQAAYRSSLQCADDPALYKQQASAGIRTQLVCGQSSPPQLALHHTLLYMFMCGVDSVHAAVSLVLLLS